MVRTPCSDKNGLKKGTWAPEEDKKLIDYVTRYGHWNWRLLPKFAGLARCGKSCRLRWLNYLRPNLKKGNYTQEEEETIIKLHRHLGNKWSAIAAELPGRTDNEIKNYWHSKLKKQFQHNSLTQPDQVSKSKDQSPIANNSSIGPFQSLPVPATTQFAEHSSSSEPSSISTEHTAVTASNENLVVEDEFAFLDADTFPVEGNFWLEPCMPDMPYFTSVPESFSPVFDADLWSHDN